MRRIGSIGASFLETPKTNLSVLLLKVLLTPPEGWEESNSSVNNWMKIQHTSYTSYGTWHMTNAHASLSFWKNTSLFQGFHHLLTFDPWRFLKRVEKGRSRYLELNLCWAFWAFQFCYVVLPMCCQKETCFRPKRCVFFFFPHCLRGLMLVTLFLSVVSQSRRRHKKCLSNWLAKVMGKLIRTNFN